MLFHLLNSLIPQFLLQIFAGLIIMLLILYNSIEVGLVNMETRQFVYLIHSIYLGTDHLRN